MRLSRYFFCVAFGLLAIALTLPVARAAERARERPQVDVALILAVDVSSSVNESEAGIQRAGYVAALRDPRVADAVRNGMIGRIALTYVEWASPNDQRQVIPWREVSDAASLQSFADELAKASYSPGTTTSISAGIDYCVKIMQESGIRAARRVIDISGDGYSDYGRNVKAARDDAVKLGITINGLPLMNKRPAYRPEIPPDLDQYYAQNVTGGRGSFTLVVKELEDFHRLVLRKLILEIADNRHVPREFKRPS